MIGIYNIICAHDGWMNMYDRNAYIIYAYDDGWACSIEISAHI